MEQIFFTRRMKLKPEDCVIVDEIGGEFGCNVYLSESDLVIPMGHQNHDLWPEQIVLEKGPFLCSQGELVFIPSRRIKAGLEDNCLSWDCGPGIYEVHLERIIDTGDYSSVKRERGLNVIVVKRPHT